MNCDSCSEMAKIVKLWWSLPGTILSLHLEELNLANCAPYLCSIHVVLQAYSTIAFDSDMDIDIDADVSVE